MGGIYDPKTGQVAWEYRVPLEEQLAYYKAHPPSALHGLRSKPVDGFDYPFDGHGEPVNVVFEVSCRCGSRLFVATGWVNADNDIGPPVTLHCDACDQEFEIFDETRDGFEALVGSVARTDTADYPDDFPEPDPPYEVMVRFEFASDVLGGDAWKGKEQDAFTWITILAKEPDGPPELLLECECA